MTLGDLLTKVKGLPPETLLCSAELDEAFGLNIAAVEIVDDARVGRQEADGKEAIELANGGQQVIVLRV